ncbi:hypothetical protein D3C80_1908340 [compost metagenome]
MMVVVSVRISLSFSIMLLNEWPSSPSEAFVPISIFCVKSPFAIRSAVPEISSNESLMDRSMKLTSGYVMIASMAITTMPATSDPPENCKTRSIMTANSKRLK